MTGTKDLDNLYLLLPYLLFTILVFYVLILTATHISSCS